MSYNATRMAEVGRNKDGIIGRRPTIQVEGRFARGECRACYTLLYEVKFF